MNMAGFDETLTRLLAVGPGNYLLRGVPGGGKSALGRKVFNRLKEQGHNVLGQNGLEAFVTLDGASMLPEDVNGIPRVDTAGRVTVFNPPEELHSLTGDVYGVLLIDDFGAADKRTRLAFLRFLGTRTTLGGIKLSNNVYIIVTTNGVKDRSGAERIERALLDRCGVIEIEPSLKDWKPWYLSQNLPEEVISFVTFCPDHFCRYEEDAAGKITTMRGWEHFARRWLKINKDTTEVMPLGMMYLHESTAVSFSAFMKRRKECIDPEELLEKGPGNAEPPTDPDMVIATISGVVEAVARRKPSEKTADQFTEVLMWLSKAGGRKHVDRLALGVQHYVSLQPSGGPKLVGALHKAVTKDPKNAEILESFFSAMGMKK
jgi:hypothetical protein